MELKKRLQFDPECDPPWGHKILIIAIIIIAIIFCLYDHLCFNFLLGDSLAAPGMKASPDLTLMYIGYLVAGFLFVYVYAKWRCPWTYEKHWHKGLEYGFILACVIFGPQLFFNAAFLEGHDLGLGGKVLLYRIIQFSLIGIILELFVEKFGRK